MCHFYVCVYQPLHTITWAGCDTICPLSLFFFPDFNRFEFSFRSPRLVATARLESPVCLILLITEGRIVGSIPFNKGISTEMQTASSTILKSGGCIHFLPQNPLRHEGFNKWVTCTQKCVGQVPVADMLDRDLMASSNTSFIIKFTLELIPLGKGMNPLIPLVMG